MNVDEPHCKFHEDLLPLINGKKILDIGCGGGVFLAHGSKESMGIDVDEAAIEECRKKGLNAIHADIFKTKLPQNRFDVVLVHHVLEHIESRKEVYEILKVAFKALRKNGIIIVGTPYAYDTNAWTHWQHERVFTVTSLTNLLRRFGFEIADVYCNVHLPKNDFWVKVFGFNPKWFFKSDYVLKLLCNFNLVRDLTVIAKKP